MEISPPPTLLLCGPTASGKSELGLLLAQMIQGEIVSVDSMQVYRGLDIGTAKPTPQELALIPHHLIDILPLSEPFDAAQFISLATQAEQDIRLRHRFPIFCGGTGLYFNAYLHGLGTAPSSHSPLRHELESTPLPLLLQELSQKDPETFHQIDTQNPRRVIRALEVIRLTGSPFSQQRASWTAPTPPPHLGIGLRRDRQDLIQRIHQRVDRMIDSGLVEETRHLLSRGLAQNLTASQAIGYRQILQYLNNQSTLEQAIEEIKIKTRQYAKRQMTWFQRKMNLTWITLTPGQPLEPVAHQILQLLTEFTAPNP